MVKVSWLQISDTHIIRHSDTQDTEEAYQKRVLSKFVEFMQNDFPKWEKSILRPQYVVITGDLAFSGKKKDYESNNKHSVRNMINAVADVLGIKASDYSKRIFTVAGNHDVDRDRLQKKPDEKKNLSIAAEPDWLNQIFLETNNKNRKNILKRFKAYCDFVQKLWGGAKRSNENILWYKKSLLVKGSKQKLHFVGINSAWLCHSYWLVHMKEGTQNKEPERTDLLASPPFFVEKLFDGISEKDLVVALMHHDYARTRDYSSNVSYLLEDKCDFILYGHEHTETWAQPTLGRAHKVRAGRFYERKDLRNAVNVIEVDVDTRQAKMLTIHYRTDKDVWEVDRGSDPTKGRWVDRFRFSPRTGILTFALSGAEKTQPDPMLPMLPVEPGKPIDLPTIKNEIIELTEAVRFQHSSRARQVRQYLEELHEHALLAAGHLGRSSVSLDKRDNALVTLYRHIDSLPAKIPSFKGLDHSVWCDLLNNFTTKRDVSRVATSLAGALDDILAYRDSSALKQHEFSSDVSISFKTVAENSKWIAAVIAEDGKAVMDVCHNRLSDLPGRIRQVPPGKNSAGQLNIANTEVPKTSSEALDSSHLKEDS